jgi:hypothetical protein
MSEDAKFLIELHNKLWGREDLFCQVFHAVDLTKEDFIELQSKLHDLNPSRNHKSYLTRQNNILETKMDFLRSRTLAATHPLTSNTDSLVPKVVLCNLKHHIPVAPMDINIDIKLNCADATHDGIDEEVKGSVEDDETEEGEFVDKDDTGKLYINEDAAALSHGPIPFSPAPFGTWI